MWTQITAPKGAVWSGSTLFAEMTENHKQMAKQTTVVVIGSLRVKLSGLNQQTTD